MRTISNGTKFIWYAFLWIRISVHVALIFRYSHAYFTLRRPSFLENEYFTWSIILSRSSFVVDFRIHLIEIFFFLQRRDWKPVPSLPGRLYAWYSESQESSKLKSWTTMNPPSREKSLNHMKSRDITATCEVLAKSDQYRVFQNIEEKSYARPWR